jgi:hypothetical protein
MLRVCLTSIYIFVVEGNRLSRIKIVIRDPSLTIGSNLHFQSMGLGNVTLTQPKSSHKIQIFSHLKKKVVFTILY